MRSVSRFQFCVYVRPTCQPDLSAKWKHRQQCNTAWNATVMFRAWDATAIFPFNYAHRVALYPCDSAHLARWESETAKSEMDELCFHHSTAEFISRLPMFSRRGSEEKEMPSISKFLIYYTVHISPLLIYNKSIIAVANNLR